MRYWLTVAILLISTVPGSAEYFTLPNGTVVETTDPPKRWLSAPYEGQIEVQRLPRAEVTKICSEALNGFQDTACAFISKASCRIVVTDDLGADLEKNVRLHEEAHCRGWPADHPLD